MTRSGLSLSPKLIPLSGLISIGKQIFGWFEPGNSSTLSHVRLPTANFILKKFRLGCPVQNHIVLELKKFPWSQKFNKKIGTSYFLFLAVAQPIFANLIFTRKDTLTYLFKQFFSFSYHFDQVSPSWCTVTSEWDFWTQIWRRNAKNQFLAPSYQLWIIPTLPSGN